MPLFIYLFINTIKCALIGLLDIFIIYLTIPTQLTRQKQNNNS
jgi:hypothetical protein